MSKFIDRILRSSAKQEPSPPEPTLDKSGKVVTTIRLDPDDWRRLWAVGRRFKKRPGGIATELVIAALDEIEEAGT